MSLVLEGLSLVLEAGGLAIDCVCCIKEKCEAIACVNDVDCDEAGKTPDAECFCRKKNCTSDPACQGDDDCPSGQECVDGICVSVCRGQPCGTDGDCPDNCVCLEGGCWDQQNVYYCHGDPDDSTADGECKQGVPQLSKGGPYLTYSLCAQSGCKSKFSCNPVIGDCYPDAAGTFEDLPTCQTNCGDGDDQGRCCESKVCYDANGNVTGVTQQCAEKGINGTPCCGGGKEPIDPDNPGAGERCVDTNSCSKKNCISDLPQEPPYCRTFRQFNSLFDDCDLCPTLGLGPCCYEVDGVATCDMHDKGYCTDVLGGTWKGNSWFTCEDARESQVDLLLDFACPDCNGAGDCSCGGNRYCYGQKCHDCNNPTTVSHLSFTRIDTEPKIGDQWKFRSRDCNGGVSTQDQSIDIYGEKHDGSSQLLTTVDNSSTNSIGQTVWTNDSTECYQFLTARKTVGNPDEAQLCAEKTAAGDPWPPVGCEPIQVNSQGECECPGGANCSGDDNDLANATYFWSPLNRPPPEGLIYTDAAWPCVSSYRTQWWEEHTSQALMIDTGETDVNGAPCFQSKSSSFTYLRLLAYLPGTGWTDVTDDWIDSTTNANETFTDLLRSEYYSEDELPFLDECEPSSVKVEEGSAGVYQELYNVGCEKPDPLSNCGGGKFRTENPLP